VENAQWSISLQEAGDELESIFDFQVQIKRHNQSEYEGKWQEWQNWTVEKTATKLIQNDQRLVLLLPAKLWPDTLQEFEIEGWWQRPQTRVMCSQCRCGFVENLSLKSNKCHGCEEHMQNKGKRLDCKVSPMPIRDMQGNSIIRKEVIRQCRLNW